LTNRDSSSRITLSRGLWTSRIAAKSGMGGGGVSPSADTEEFVITTPSMLRAQQDRIAREVQRLQGKRNSSVGAAIGKDEVGAQSTAKRVGNPPNENLGPSGPEPTRYGDWERSGRCSDF